MSGTYTDPETNKPKTGNYAINMTNYSLVYDDGISLSGDYSIVLVVIDPVLNTSVLDIEHEDGTVAKVYYRNGKLTSGSMQGYFELVVGDNVYSSEPITLGSSARFGIVVSRAGSWHEISATLNPDITYAQSTNQDVG